MCTQISVLYIVQYIITIKSLINILSFKVNVFSHKLEKSET